ncbi:MAG: DUF2169 domain-containing protein [Deltaproteobacteria bacterium]|nr:DUF2169 domain-containing protein [Deltaproteobacteria bacterium]
MVFLKGTFDLVHDGVCAVAAEQALTTGPLHWDDDPSQSLRLDSDFAVLKPRAECHFVGHAHAPGGEPAGSLLAGFRVGAVARSLAVFGDRTFDGYGAVSAPAPFHRIPIRWERRPRLRAQPHRPRHRPGRHGGGPPGAPAQPRRQRRAHLQRQRPAAPLVLRPRPPVVARAHPQGGHLRPALAEDPLALAARRLRLQLLPERPDIAARRRVLARRRGGGSPEPHGVAEPLPLPGCRGCGRAASRRCAEGRRRSSSRFR